MGIQADYLVVGSGLTGATIARLLADAGREVVVLERRATIGGNVCDAVDLETNLRYHLHGPHYFRTHSDSIWEFVTRFADFYPFEVTVLSRIGDMLCRWPPSVDELNAFASTAVPTHTGPAATFTQAALAKMPHEIFERFVRPYTEKQWGCPCDELTPLLAERFEVRTKGEHRLSLHAHQGLPKGGYSAWMGRMLSGIPIVSAMPYNRTEHVARCKLIYTGPVDEYFDFRYGRLPYRAQRRYHVRLPGQQLLQPVVQVNNPTATGSIRSVEWAHLAEPGRMRIGSMVTFETPYTPDDPNDYEYPSQRLADQLLAKDYLTRALEAERQDGVVICGRLGTYRYMDMDHAIAFAMKIARDLLRS